MCLFFEGAGCRRSLVTIRRNKMVKKKGSVAVKGLSLSTSPIFMGIIGQIHKKQQKTYGLALLVTIITLPLHS